MSANEDVMGNRIIKNKMGKNKEIKNNNKM
jgi:hypothetical protein